MGKSTARRGSSLSTLAASLDTKKRALPADAQPPPPNLTRSLPAREVAVRPEVKREVVKRLGAVPAPLKPVFPPARPAPGAQVTRSTALSSLQRAPTTPAPSKFPQAKTPASTGKSRRKYPRAELNVSARLSLADDPTRYFEATLPTVNISVGGMFLESSFFLKAGTKLLVTLSLPPKGREVAVKGEVVRVETLKTGESGFALRFTEYLEGSEVALATHFLAPVLREFITAYAKQHRFDASPEYLAHTADVLAAWELKKAELGGDVWAMAGLE